MSYQYSDFDLKPRSEKILIEKRGALFAEAEDMVKLAEKEKRDLTPGESRNWFRIANEIDRISADIQSIHNDNVLDTSTTGSKGGKDRAAGAIGDLMKAAHAFAMGKGTSDQRRDFDVSSAGAVITDPIIQATFFESFKANNPLIDLGAQILTAENYTQFPVQTANPGVVWFSEGDSAIVPDSSATVSAVKMEFKIPAMLMLASNFWLEDSNRLGGEVIGRMAISTLQEAVIKAALHGSTANAQPNGLDNITGVQTVDAGGVVLADYAKFVEAVRKLLAANVPLERIGGIISPNVWEQMNLLKAQDDQPLLLPEGLRNVPMFTSSAVLEDYGANDDETRVYMGDFSNLLIGMNSTPVVQVLRDRFADTFQTAFLFHMRFDIKAVRPNTFVRIEDILTV